MFAFSVHLESLCTTLDNSVHECFTRYSSNPTPLLCIFCRYYYMFVSVYCLHTIPLCDLSGILEVISDFTFSLNPWVILFIRSGWEILRVFLVSSRFIVHPTKSTNSTIDQVEYYFLMNSILFVNAGLYPISSLPSTYMITITVLGLFTPYKILGSFLHCFNPALRFIFLVYYLNHKRYACERP